MSSEKLTVVEAAKRLGVSPYTVRTWLRQRRLGHYRLGRRVVIADADLDRFLLASRVEPRVAVPRRGDLSERGGAVAEGHQR